MWFKRNRRESDRTPFANLNNILLSDTSGDAITGLGKANVIDISMGGCCLQLQATPPINLPEDDRVCFELPMSDNAPLTINGYVVWEKQLVEEEVKLGIQFQALSPADRQRLDTTLRQQPAFNPAHPKTWRLWLIAIAATAGALWLLLD